MQILITTATQTIGCIAEYRMRTLIPVLVIAYLLGLLAYASLKISANAYVPGIICFAVTVVAVVVVKREFIAHFLLPLMIIASVTFISICATAIPVEDLGSRLLSEVQLIYSMVIAFTGYVLISRLDRTTARSICRNLIALVLIGCVFELTTSFERFVNLIRYFIYPPLDVAGEDSRASILFGGPRPNLFASEPAHLAIFCLIIFLGWWALAYSRKEKVVVLLLTFLTLVIIRSPILLLCPVCYYLLELHTANKSIFSLIRFPRLLGIGLLFLAALSAMVSLPRISERVDRIISGADDSFNIRIVAPAYYTMGVLRVTPLFGIGIGGTKTLRSRDLYFKALKDAHANEQRIKYLASFTDVGQQINNDFWLFWSEYGLVGGVIIAVVLLRLLRRRLKRRILWVVLIVVLLMQTMGGIYSPYFLAATWALFGFISINKASHPDVASFLVQDGFRVRG